MNPFSGQTMRHTKKMLRNKIVCFKKIYKFDVYHFLLKRAVFVLSIKNSFYKITKSIFRPNYAGYEENVKK